MYVQCMCTIKDKTMNMNITCNAIFVLISKHFFIYQYVAINAYCTSFPCMEINYVIFGVYSHIYSPSGLDPKDTKCILSMWKN